jgi:hypothetical protein
MLPSTDKERQIVVDYMAAQAPDEDVHLLQKVYSENVNGVTHDIWDAHTDQGRWWIITNPTNLYSQEQFPNMDIALTFHVGLCLRMPRADRPPLPSFPVEPLLACTRELSEAQQALLHAREVQDYQTIGVRCRESLLSLIHAVQAAVPFQNPDGIKRSDFRGWSSLIADTILSGSSHHARRSLLKSSAASAWEVANWLAHSRTSHFHDAEATVAATDLTISLFTVICIRHLRGVPEACPSCGSQRLSPERGHPIDEPDAVYERPVCQVCDWTGDPIKIEADPRHVPNRTSAAPPGDCVVVTVPLRGPPPPKPSQTE